MSLFDWVESGLSHYGVELPWFRGSYSSTMGDSLSTFFGGRHTHLFGSDIKLVCDPEDMLMYKLAEALPLFSALLSGVGGQTTFVYGSNVAATYIGPRVNIQRAPTHNKVSKYWLARAGEDGTDGEDEVDRATSAAVGTLSALICATAAALELAMHFKYPAMGTSDEEEYGDIPEILKTCAMSITDRLMALLRELELKGSWANFAEQFTKEAAFNVFLANLIVGVFFPPALLGLVLTTATAYVAKEVALNSAKALAPA